MAAEFAPSGGAQYRAASLWRREGSVRVFTSSDGSWPYARLRRGRNAPWECSFSTYEAICEVVWKRKIVRPSNVVASEFPSHTSWQLASKRKTFN